jgi:hypothetical protein
MRILNSDSFGMDIKHLFLFVYAYKYLITIFIIKTPDSCLGLMIFPTKKTLVEH